VLSSCYEKARQNISRFSVLVELVRMAWVSTSSALADFVQLR
jgi:hypothetical protein